MPVRVISFGTRRRLSQLGRPGIWEGELPARTTIRSMLETLGASKYESNAAAINGIPAGLDDTIPDDSSVVVVTPMGGVDQV